MSDGEEDRPTDSIVSQAGQALFRLGRLFGRPPMKNQLRQHTGQSVELSHILVTEAVESGPCEPGGEITVGTVAERLGIDPSTASRLVAEAIDAGYLARLTSPLDKRRLCLELTDAGHDLKAQAQGYQRAVFEHITREWTEGERQEFGRLLIRFVDSVAETYARPNQIPHGEE